MHQLHVAIFLQTPIRLRTSLLSSNKSLSSSKIYLPPRPSPPTEAKFRPSPRSCEGLTAFNNRVWMGWGKACQGHAVREKSRVLVYLFSWPAIEGVLAASGALKR